MKYDKIKKQIETKFSIKITEDDDIFVNFVETELVKSDGDEHYMLETMSINDLNYWNIEYQNL